MAIKGNLEIYIRNFIFGVEDSLVSTVGLLSGVAAAGVEKKEVLLTGVVLVFVEAFSMGSGSYLSEHSIEEYEKQREVSPKKSIAAALVMFFSYFVSGFIPILPYILFPVSQAIWISIAASVISLFILGLVSSRFFKVNMLKHAVEMAVVGGLAIAVGTIVGKVFNL